MTAVPCRPSGGLTAAQVALFHRDGYLTIPEALDPSTVQALLDETRSLLSNFDLAAHPKTRFRTGGPDGTDHVGDNYFLGSANKVRFFFDEDAFEPVTGRLARPKEAAVNKIGHCLHDLSPPFARLLRDDDMRVRPAAVARDLGFRDPRCLQSMVICKQPGTGAAVPPHQDSTFLYTDPPSALGFWYALEHATRHNGCLAVLPGSHKWAPIARRLVRVPVGTGMEMERNTGPTFPRGDGYEYGEDEEAEAEAAAAAAAEAAGAHVEWRLARDKDQDYVPVEVKAGSLVLIHGNLLHKSERNTSAHGRIAYTFHAIEGPDYCAYDPRNWLQPPAAGFTRLHNGLARPSEGACAEC